MKLCRYDDNRLGLVESDQVIDVSAALQMLPEQRYPYPLGDQLVAHLPQLIPVIEDMRKTSTRKPLATVRLLSPVANPGKIIAAPVNYTRHLQEVLNDREIHNDNQINHIQRAGLFLKAQSSLVGPSHGVQLTMPDRRTDHEIELVVVIGKEAKDVSVDRALDYVAGYCIGLDITIRGPEERSFRKSADTYTVMGPWLTTVDEVPDPGALEMELLVNGETRQKTSTADLILSVQQLISFGSKFYTLQPGDAIFTGTPEGVSQIAAGDVLHARLDKLGSMQVTIQSAA